MGKGFFSDLTQKATFLSLSPNALSFTMEKPNAFSLFERPLAIVYNHHRGSSDMTTLVMSINSTFKILTSCKEISSLQLSLTDSPPSSLVRSNGKLKPAETSPMLCHSSLTIRQHIRLLARTSTSRLNSDFELPHRHPTNSSGSEGSKILSSYSEESMNLSLRNFRHHLWVQKILQDQLSRILKHIPTTELNDLMQA